MANIVLLKGEKMLIQKIDPFSQPEIVEAIASVYKLSFGNEPWNEGFVCPVCKNVFALSYTSKLCPVCSKKSRSVLSVEYWPIGKIISDFYEEMGKPEAICVIAQVNDEIIGVAWGYKISANPNLDAHLEAPNLHKSIHGDLFYLDECAIIPPHQGKGIGKILVNYIFGQQKQEQILLRTMEGSKMYNLIKNMGGVVVKHISRNRIIMRLIIA